MELIKKIVHFLSSIVYLLIGVYVIVCVPILFSYKPLVVLSGSMEPTLKVGSIIYYKEVAENELKEGDIITFKTENGEYISHRINSIDDGQYETKGDANNSADPVKITYQNILGEVMNVYIPYLGYYVQFINNNQILSIVVALIILILEFILSNLKMLFDNKKESGEKYEKNE